MKRTKITLAPGDPTLGQVMRRPTWIGVLAACLVVAGIFAALCQWQLSRAVLSDPASQGPTEVSVPLTDVIEPGEPLYDVSVGQQVTVTGTIVAGDTLIIANRVQGEEIGYWVTAHVRADTTADPADAPSLAVGMGWAPTRAAAESAVAAIDAGAGVPIDFRGRLNTSQAPGDAGAKGDPFEMTTMSVAALINIWAPDEAASPEIFQPYLISFDAPAGLDAIDAPEPVIEFELNWLNIFYAIEWVVFGVFAIYLWVRLARDAWEKEIDEAALSRGEPSPFE